MRLRTLCKVLNDEFIRTYWPDLCKNFSAKMTPSGNLIVQYKKNRVVFDHRKRWTLERLANQLDTLKGVDASYAGLEVRIGPRDISLNDQGEVMGSGTCLH